MKFKRSVGAFLFLIGVIVLISSQSGITGNVVSEMVDSVSSVFGLLFIIVGLVLMAYRGLERDLAREIKKRGEVITDPKKLKKVLKKGGYEGRDVKEGYQILDREGNPLTVIPRHNLSRGVFYNILNTLEKGESNFRRYS